MIESPSTSAVSVQHTRGACKSDASTSTLSSTVGPIQNIIATADSAVSNPPLPPPPLSSGSDTSDADIPAPVTPPPDTTVCVGPVVRNAVGADEHWDATTVGVGFLEVLKQCDVGLVLNPKHPQHEMGTVSILNATNTRDRPLAVEESDLHSVSLAESQREDASYTPEPSEPECAATATAGIQLSRNQAPVEAQPRTISLQQPIPMYPAPSSSSMCVHRPLAQSRRPSIIAPTPPTTPYDWTGLQVKNLVPMGLHFPYLFQSLEQHLHMVQLGLEDQGPIAHSLFYPAPVDPTYNVLTGWIPDPRYYPASNDDSQYYFADAAECEARP
jgi:hypothetical protein